MELAGSRLELWKSLDNPEVCEGLPNSLLAVQSVLGGPWDIRGRFGSGARDEADTKASVLERPNAPEPPQQSVQERTRRLPPPTNGADRVPRSRPGSAAAHPPRSNDRDGTSDLEAHRR